MTVTVCLAVMVDEVEPPPQPSAARVRRITKPNPITPAIALRCFGVRLLPAKTNPARPIPENGIQAMVIPVIEYPDGGVTATAAMV